MIYETKYSQKFTIYLNKKNVIKFNNGIEFTLTPTVDLLPTTVVNQYFEINEVKGNFKILSIKSQGHQECFSKRRNTVDLFRSFVYHIINVTIVTPIEYKKVDFGCIPYSMKIPALYMILLKLYHYIEGVIVLPSSKQFKYFIRKVSAEKVQIHIENPYNAKINGENGDFIQETAVTEDFCLTLNFQFDADQLTSESDNSFMDNKSNPFIVDDDSDSSSTTSDLVENSSPSCKMDVSNPLYNLLSDPEFQFCCITWKKDSKSSKYSCQIFSRLCKAVSKS